MNNTVNKNIEEWSNHPFCEETRNKLNHLKNDKVKWTISDVGKFESAAMIGMLGCWQAKKSLPLLVFL